MKSEDEKGDESPQACGVLTEYVVTRWYRAPEVMLLPKCYSTALDLWSTGCILGEILGRRPMFQGKGHVEMILLVAKVLGTPSEDDLKWLPAESDAYRFVRKVCPRCERSPFSELYPNARGPCLDLLSGLLTWDPGQRLTAPEALEHEYLLEFKQSKVETPEVFDWSFDGFKASSSAVRDRLYCECARFHPEIVARDAEILKHTAPHLLSHLAPSLPQPAECRLIQTPSPRLASPSILPPRPTSRTSDARPASAQSLSGADLAKRLQEDREQRIAQRLAHEEQQRREEQIRLNREELRRQQQEWQEQRRQIQQQQMEWSRQLSGGYPSGPPVAACAWRNPLLGNPLLEHRAAPPQATIPQPHFASRGGSPQYGTPNGTPVNVGRSITPPRAHQVLAR